MSLGIGPDTHTTNGSFAFMMYCCDDVSFVHMMFVFFSIRRSVLSCGARQIENFNDFNNADRNYMNGSYLIF